MLFMLFRGATPPHDWRIAASGLLPLHGNPCKGRQAIWPGMGNTATAVLTR